MIPLLLMAGQAAMSAKQAQDAKKDAQRREDLSGMLSTGDQAYSGFTGGPVRAFQPAEFGASPLAAGISGGISGYSQGQAINQASAQDRVNNAYSKMLNSGALPPGWTPAPGAGAPDTRLQDFTASVQKAPTDPRMQFDINKGKRADNNGYARSLLGVPA